MWKYGEKSDIFCFIYNRNCKYQCLYMFLFIFNAYFSFLLASRALLSLHVLWKVCTSNKVSRFFLFLCRILQLYNIRWKLTKVLVTVWSSLLKISLLHPHWHLYNLSKKQHLVLFYMILQQSSGIKNKYFTNCTVSRMLALRWFFTVLSFPTIFFYCVFRSPRTIIALSILSERCSDFFCGNAVFKSFNYIEGSKMCPLINKMTWQCSLRLLNEAICSPKMSAPQKSLRMLVIWTDCNIVWSCFWGI